MWVRLDVLQHSLRNSLRISPSSLPLQCLPSPLPRPPLACVTWLLIDFDTSMMSWACAIIWSLCCLIAALIRLEADCGGRRSSG